MSDIREWPVAINPSADPLSESAAALELESGYRLESDDVAHLRHSVKTGVWDDAAALLRRLGVTVDSERVCLFALVSEKR